MSERERRQVRLAFEPNRFAAEQLIEVYEQLKPTEARTKPTQSVTDASQAKPTSRRTGGKR